MIAGKVEIATNYASGAKTIESTFLTEVMTRENVKFEIVFGPRTRIS